MGCKRNFVLSLGLLLLAFVACSRATIECSFDLDTCGFYNDDTDFYDWRRRRYLTGTILTGPLGDHTSGLGSFMYADASDAKRDSVARLISPMYPGSSRTPTSLVIFWFSMWSINPLAMGTLNVYTMYEGKRNPTPLWSTSGVQRSVSRWVEGRILVTAVSEFQLVFEAVRGRGERSDIAIDDLTVINAEIPSTCDFEGGSFGPMCIFYQDMVDDDFDWTWHTGETPTVGTGPLYDHTIANSTEEMDGHYMYIETTRNTADTTARLVTYPLFSDGGVCQVNFWYHSFGSNLGDVVGALRVITSSSAGEVLESGITLGRSSNPLWREETINLRNIVGSFQIIFEGRRGNGNEGDIALDDISVGCTDVDKCASNPCWNGGSCVQNANSFSCECVDGWTGLNCQLNIDDCDGVTCDEPRVCVDYLNRYECECPEGYSGENCEIKSNEPDSTEVIPGVSNRQPIIIGASTMAAGVVIITILVACFCIRTAPEETKEINNNKPTSMGLEEVKAHDNEAYYANEGAESDKTLEEEEETEGKPGPSEPVTRIAV